MTIFLPTVLTVCAEIGMLQVFSKKRLMNYLYRLFFDRFFVLLPYYRSASLNKSTLLRVFRFAGKPTFGFYYLLACGLKVLRVCPQPGLRLCGLAGFQVCWLAVLRAFLFISLKILSKRSLYNLIIIHIFFNGIKPYSLH
jgi:hypothetical protein